MLAHSIRVIASWINGPWSRDVINVILQHPNLKLRKCCRSFPDWKMFSSLCDFISQQLFQHWPSNCKKKKRHVARWKPLAQLIRLFFPVSSHGVCENWRWYQVGFCQPRISNEAWPVRFDLSDTYIELAKLLGWCLVYLCLWPQNSLFFPGGRVSQKMRSWSSFRAFNHAAGCQNRSRTSIIGLKINMILKNIIFIRCRLEPAVSSSIYTLCHRNCLYAVLAALKDICCGEGKKMDRRMKLMLIRSQTPCDK